MTDTKINKTSRKTETREKDARKRGWVPPSNLEAPEPPEGFHHRWVRSEYRGMSDEKNIIGRLRSGYEFVKLDEYPDRLDLPSIADGKYKGVIGIGGLLLMRCPVEVKEDRERHARAWQGHVAKVFAAVVGEGARSIMRPLPQRYVQRDRVYCQRCCCT